MTGPRTISAADQLLALVSLAGFIVLVLRLVSKSMDASGHMTWSLMMATQCVTQRLPWCLSIAAWLAVT